MSRALLACGVAALLSGLISMISLAPDPGPPIAAGPSRASRAPATPAPRPPTLALPSLEIEPALPVEELIDEPEAGPPPFRRPEPLPPIDPDQVFGSELRGVASAAVSHREGFQACLDAFRRTSDQRGYEGRLVIQITVSAAGERGVAHTEVVNGPVDPAFHSCMEEVLAEARFEAPERDFSMVWPVPISDPEP